MMDIKERLAPVVKQLNQSVYGIFKLSQEDIKKAISNSDMG